MRKTLFELYPQYINKIGWKTIDLSYYGFNKNHKPLLLRELYNNTPAIAYGIGNYKEQAMNIEDANQILKITETFHYTNHRYLKLILHNYPEITTKLSLKRIQHCINNIIYDTPTCLDYDGYISLEDYIKKYGYCKDFKIEELE